MIIHEQEITWAAHKLTLTNQKAIYWEKQKTLILSDLHLGKAAHFRKAGLAIPSTVSKNDLLRLENLLQKYQPKTLLINGDMFHSDYNTEIDEFAKWKENFGEINFLLVKGNHDKQKKEVYTDLAIDVREPTFNSTNFCFIHDAAECSSELYSIGGHIHPGISIVSKTKQRLKFPCFYFSENYAILPAFSVFTGLQLLRPLPNDQVFAITPTKVVKV